MRFEPGQLIGRYRIDGVIAWGGFAVVYRAYDTSLEHDVAIKVLADNYAFDAQARSRFSAEARSMRMLDNPAVVTIFDIGETDQGQPYLVMNLADRGTLADRLTADDFVVADTSVQSDEFGRVAHFLVEALGAMHDARLVHRDVKPSNILIRSGDSTIPGVGSLFQPGDHLLLADLGLVKDLAEGSGFTAQAGSVGYAAPEQLSKLSQVDERSDVFGASAVLAQMLMGRLPEEGETWAQLLGGSEHPRLAAALLRGLSDEPDGRQDSIDDWAEDLGAGLEEWSNPAPWWVRRWLPAAAGAVVAILLGLVVFIVGVDRPATDDVSDDRDEAALLTTTTSVVVGPGSSSDPGPGPEEDGDDPVIDPPSEVRVAEVEGDSVTVEWAPFGDDRAGVNLALQGPDQDNLVYFDTAPNTSTSYTFYRLSPDSDYEFGLVAVGADKTLSSQVVVTARTETGSAIDDLEPGTKLRSFRSDLCVTSSGGPQLEQHVCIEGAAPSQRFELAQVDPEGLWSLRHPASGTCLTLGAVRTAGSGLYNMELQECVAGTAQQFRSASVSGVHELRFQHLAADGSEVELCFDFQRGGEDPGTPVVAFACNKSRNQRWILELP